MKPLPPQSRLAELFDYSVTTGLTTRRNSDKMVGGVSAAGYRQVRVDGTMYYLHRLIWKLVTGEDPEFIDHIDRDRQNNAWNNLRSVNRRQNNLNQSKGGPRRWGDRWLVQTTQNNKRIHHGVFDTYEEALVCYNEEVTQHYYGQD